MLSCHKIIKDEICYNEIVNDRQLFSNSPINREFEGCIIQQSDGSLMACAKLEAGDISLFYENSIKKRDTVSQFLTLLGKNYEINFEWRKSKKFFKYISCEKIMTGSAREIESRRRENFENYNNYINELYITLIKRNFNPSVLMTRGDFDEFCQCMQSLSSAFSNIACICSFLKNSELICYLKSCLDLTDIKVMDFKHDNSLSDCLLTENYLMKTIPLIIEGEERKFISCLSLTALPSFTQPDLFNFCSYVDCDFRLVIKYKNYDRNESFNKLNHKKKSYKNSLFSITKYVKKDITNQDISDEYNHISLNGKEQCELALKDMSEKKWCAGLCQVSICLNDDNENGLYQKTKTLKKAFQKQGMLLKNERIGNTLCFLSLICGAKRLYNPLFVLSQNFADMLHLSVLSQGSRHSSLLEKRTQCEIPYIYCRNMDGSIHYFSLYGEHGLKGHTFITGPTGSGKSVLLSLLAAQWLKYKNTRAIIIDRDLSSYRLIKENNGKFFYPIYDSSSFQPLKNAKNNMQNCIEFIKSICFCQNIAFGADEHEECINALNLLEEGKETMTMFYHMIRGQNQNSRLVPALLPFTGSNEFAGLFDNNKDSLDGINRLIMIETNRILTNSVSQKNISIPFFVYLLSKLDMIFSDLTPTLLIIDEGWKALKNDTFSAFFEEWIKTLRKKNVDVVFSVTNLNDITNTALCETIMSNMETKIFFKDLNSVNTIESQNYQSIGLSDYLISLLADLPDFCPLVIQGKSNTIIDFDMQSQIEYLTTPDHIKKKFDND